jgi:chromosome segregation ATPase
MRKHLAAMIAAASLLAVAACDNRDYEAELATLESDLEGARSENEQLQTELDELRAQAEAQPALEEGAVENVKTQLNNVVQTAAQTFERVGSTGDPNAEALRADMQLIVQSAQSAAEDLGLQLETVAMDTDAGPAEGTPEPAAGPDTQQQGESATQQQPPAPEQPAAQQGQPAGEEEQPAAQ